MNKSTTVVGECGDCGHPIFADGDHNPMCSKPSERTLRGDASDYKSGMVYASGCWMPNIGSKDHE